MNPSTDTTAKSTRTGILLVVFGLSVAAFTGALMKLLSEHMSAHQIAWFRFLVFALVLFPFVARKFGLSALKPARPAMQVFRGLTMSAATICFIIGAQTIDYADAVAILYAYPFLLTVIAVLFLGERVKWVGWVGVFGGFLGVLFVVRPELSGVNKGSLFVFACAVIVSIQMAMNRKLGMVAHPLVTGLWGGIVASVSLTIILPFYWTPVAMDQLWILILMALTGTVNQTCLVYGFAKAEASTLAPFTYFEIVAGVVFGLLVFDTLPDWLAWIGMGLIVVSGIVVARSISRQDVVRRNPKY